MLSPYTAAVWWRYKDYPDSRVGERFAREVRKLGSTYHAPLWVMEREFKKVNRSVSERIHKLRREVEKEFPFVARLTAASLGPILLWSTRREEKRPASRHTMNLLPLLSTAIGYRLRSRQEERRPAGSSSC